MSDTNLLSSNPSHLLPPTTLSLVLMFPVPLRLLTWPCLEFFPSLLTQICQSLCPNWSSFTTPPCAQPLLHYDHVTPQPLIGDQETEGTTSSQSHLISSQRWWFLVILNIIFLLVGQTAATLLGRFYYDKGGNSKWMSTVVQTVGFPILVLALFFFPKNLSSVSPSTRPAGWKPSFVKLALVYIGIGLLVAGDNFMYSYGLLYLPVSTYSLTCATQLAFNAVFSYFLNGQKFTHLILNSVVVLTFSAALLGVHADPENSGSIPQGKYILGFILTLGASATYSLILSLMQFSFQKVLKKETFYIVLEMQIYTAAVASCIALVGLFASGEWKTIGDEMHAFNKGAVSYTMTLVGITLSWQIASIGVVGLIFVVSSLFSNVISTLALPVVPVFAVIFFHDKMDGVKIMALLLALWGFTSYIYQNYLDDNKRKKVLRTDAREEEP